MIWKHSRSNVAGLLVVGLILGVSAKESFAQRSEGIDASFIPEKAIGAIVGYPRRVMLDPKNDLMPREILTAQGMETFGVDPLLIEEFVVFFGTPSPFAPPSLGAVLRFSEGQDVDDWILDGMSPAKLGDQDFYRSDFGGLCVIQVADKTVLVGDETTLGEMVEVGEGAEKPDTVLIAMLGAAAKPRDVNFFMAVEPVRELVTSQLAAMPIPEPFRRLTEIPELVDEIKISADAGWSLKASMVLTAGSQDNAAKLEELMNEGMEMARSAFVAEVSSEMADEDDPVTQATLKYLVRASHVVKEMMQPEREGNDLVIELEDDMATSATLVALLLPAVQAAREAARRTSSVNNLKQLALAMHNYHDTHGRFPPRAILSDDGEPLLSWRVALLPYLEEAELYDQFRLDEPWDSEHNRALIEQMPQALRNPNLAMADRTNYLAPVGEGTVWSGKEGTRIREILDGTSNTIMIVESDPAMAVVWTKPDDLDYDPDRPMDGLGNVRPGIFLAALCDGSVQSFSMSIAAETVKAMMSQAGGEVVR